MSDREALEAAYAALLTTIADAIGYHIQSRDQIIDALIPIRNRIKEHLDGKSNLDG
ncbi:MAG TPA: hypothetical protein PLO16_15705 [Acidocella sp.]|nr:hypothetical protein [Acidocella sp.]